MDVVARLPPALAAHLRVVVGREHRLAAAESWPALLDVLRARPIDVAVLDPCLAGASVDDVRLLLTQFPSLPIVLYSAITPRAMKASVELARLGVHQTVIQGFDDEPVRFRGLLERVPAYAMSERVLTLLAPALAAAPAALIRAVERLFRTPTTFRDVRDLAASAGMTRRSLDRNLDRLGIASAKMLVISARVLRAYHYMRDPGYSLLDVSRKLGYPQARLFSRQMRLATGLSPSAVRQQADAESFVAELAARLLVGHPAGGTGAGGGAPPGVRRRDLPRATDPADRGRPPDVALVARAVPRSRPAAPPLEPPHHAAR